jgi:GTPase SAR1 family protein
VGNKCDLEEERTVQKEMAESFSLMNNIEFIEASAKNNANVQKAFERISEITMKRQKEL